MKAELKLEGTEEVVRRLVNLANRSPEIVRGALRKAGKPIVQQAKARAPVRTGQLKQDITIAIRGREATGKYAVVGAKHPGRYYLHLVEQGTASRLNPIMRKGQVIGQYRHPGTQPKPFLRPALDSAGPQALRAFIDELDKAIREA